MGGRRGGGEGRGRGGGEEGEGKAVRVGYWAVVNAGRAICPKGSLTHPITARLSLRTPPAAHTDACTE